MPAFAVTSDLNWSVSKRPLFFQRTNGSLSEWDTKVAIVRDDTERCLGTVSQTYETVQNRDLLKLVEPLVQEGVLTVENMGYLAHGAKVFAQARITQEFQVIGESYNAFITLLNGHVGNASVAIGPTATRVICGNSFTMAYADLSERFRHSEGVTARVLDSKAVLNYVNGAMENYAKKVEALASAPCSAGQFQKAVEKIYQKDAKNLRHIETLNHLFYNGAGNEGRTFYDCVNAVTDFGSNRSRKTPAGRFNYVQFGQGARVNQRAMKVALEMATA